MGKPRCNLGYVDGRGGFKALFVDRHTYHPAVYLVHYGGAEYDRSIHESECCPKVCASASRSPRFIYEVYELYHGYVCMSFAD